MTGVNLVQFRSCLALCSVLWLQEVQALGRRLSPELWGGWTGESWLNLADRKQALRSLLCSKLDLSSVFLWPPIGRVAKMAFVNSAVKPPRDVRRRQEKFGTGGPLLPGKTK